MCDGDSLRVFHNLTYEASLPIFEFFFSLFFQISFLIQKVFFIIITLYLGLFKNYTKICHHIAFNRPMYTFFYRQLDYENGWNTMWRKKTNENKRFFLIFGFFQIFFFIFKSILESSLIKSESYVVQENVCVCQLNAIQRYTFLDKPKIYGKEESLQS